VVPGKIASALEDPYHTLRDMHITGPKTVRSKKEDKAMARQLEGRMWGDLAGRGDWFKIPGVSGGEGHGK
jgi:hypothetical protein